MRAGASSAASPETASELAAAEEIITPINGLSPASKKAQYIRMKYRLSVTKGVLVFTAGVVWVCVGTALLTLAIVWLSRIPDVNNSLFMAAGMVLALIVHHFGFLKIVDRNIERISSANEKACLFSFIPLKSYLTIAAMMALGAILRHSAIPKQYLSVLYSGIGVALLLSSVRYLRVSLRR